MNFFAIKQFGLNYFFLKLDVSQLEFFAQLTTGYNCSFHDENLNRIFTHGSLVLGVLQIDLALPSFPDGLLGRKL